MMKLHYRIYFGGHFNSDMLLFCNMSSLINYGLYTDKL